MFIYLNKVVVVIKNKVNNQSAVHSRQSAKKQSIMRLDIINIRH